MAEEASFNAEVQAHEGKIDLVDLIDQPAWKTILLDLVKSEKMDAWGIDIAELADKYIKKISALENTDLRLPANAILASAILLKFKSRVLRLSDLDEDDEFLKQEEARQRELWQLDSELPELMNIKKIKEGRISLDELVESIEAVLEKTKQKRLKERPIEVPEFKIPFASENIDEKMEVVFEKIKENADSQGLVLFSRLINGSETNSYKIVDTFIPCLFLHNKGKITLWQDDWFGEIFISIVK
ncbi:MAG: segregation/condensation protein A [Candidatus Diapherotrites archaeon]